MVLNLLVKFLKGFLSFGTLGYSTKFNFFWDNETDHVCTEISSLSSLVKNICADELYKISLQIGCDENLIFLFLN